LPQNRLAAIDIGTNSIRCIVVEACGEVGYRILDDEKATVRLGAGLYRSGTICSQSWQAAGEALSRMRRIAEGFGVRAIEAVATSAVRKAANGQEFMEDMLQRGGFPIRLISGEEEAALAALSAWRNFDMAQSRHALLDIGGGSAEIVLATGNHIEEVHSFEAGAVYMTDRFLPREPILKADLKRLQKYLRRQTHKLLEQQEFPLQQLIGSGGTVTNIGRAVMAQRNESFDSVHGYEVLHSDLVHLLSMLVRMTPGERAAVPGISPERGDIIVAGVAVVEGFMRSLGANLLKINARGIREGLIIRSLQKHDLVSGDMAALDWRSSAEALARSCQANLAHARQVARLALRLFDALRKQAALTDEDRMLLETAALLHDIGYFISYNRHHKHSYHLIRHARLDGFTPRQKELVANVARYHRCSLPKKKHLNFSGLSAEDQQLVQRLGGILRLADGLDRCRNQRVTELGCRLEGGRLYLTLQADSGDLSVEIYGASRKSDLFERAFGRKVLVEGSS
jgi:exopolyphosphatase/guanosine-5'-triphosphate,3'-diphosphate pyrophosphatase